MDDPFVLAGETFTSRLVMGTGGVSSLDVLDAALEASGTELTTVAMRRVDPGARGSILDVLTHRGVRVLPNTAGCYTAGDAVLTATTSSDVTTSTSPTAAHAVAAAIVSSAIARASAIRDRSSSASLNRVFPAAASLTGTTTTQRPGTRPP